MIIRSEFMLYEVRIIDAALWTISINIRPTDSIVIPLLNPWSSKEWMWIWITVEIKDPFQ